MQNIAYYTAVSRFLETAKIQLFREPYSQFVLANSLKNFLAEQSRKALRFTHLLNFKEHLRNNDFKGGH